MIGEGRYRAALCPVWNRGNRSGALQLLDDVEDGALAVAGGGAAE